MFKTKALEETYIESDAYWKRQYAGEIMAALWAKQVFDGRAGVTKYTEQELAKQSFAVAEKLLAVVKKKEAL